MKKLVLPIIAVAALVFSSCFSSSGMYSSKYEVTLSSVESPANAKQQFGETKVVSFTEDGQSKYSYEDDYIKIIWYVSRTEFHFNLTNKTTHSIKLNWDDFSYVSTTGQVGRVMHTGVKFIDRNNSQPATMIPRGATISDILVPTDNIFYSQYGGWQQNNLVRGENVIGKTMVVLMPIMIENVQNDYTFTFKVNPKQNGN